MLIIYSSPKICSKKHKCNLIDLITHSNLSIAQSKDKLALQGKERHILRTTYSDLKQGCEEVVK